MMMSGGRREETRGLARKRSFLMVNLRGRDCKKGKRWIEREALKQASIFIEKGSANEG